MYVHDEILFYMVQRKINLKQKLQIKYFFFLPARDQNSSMVQKFLKAGITDICRKSKPQENQLDFKPGENEAPVWCYAVMIYLRNMMLQKLVYLITKYVKICYLEYESIKRGL